MAKEILEGLKSYVNLAEEVDVRPLLSLEVESDSSKVINAINREVEDLSEISLMIKGIVDVLPTANVSSFSKCSRSENRGAHALARAAAGNGDYSVSFWRFLYLGLRDSFFGRERVFPPWFSSVLFEQSGVLLLS